MLCEKATRAECKCPLMGGDDELGGAATSTAAEEEEGATAYTHVQCKHRALAAIRVRRRKEKKTRRNIGGKRSNRIVNKEDKSNKLEEDEIK